MADRFAQLRRLAFMDLDQDWDSAHPDPDDHVRDVVRYEGVAAAEALLGELDDLRNDPLSEEDAEWWWTHDLRSGFLPASLDMTFEQWFDHMADVLRDALKSPPPGS